MARKVRQTSLENRTNRLKLPVAKKPIFVRIGQGVSLGYRRNQTAGTWVLRIADGSGGANQRGFAIADDHEEANGVDILTYWQAQDRAKQLARGAEAAPAAGPVTVGAAVEAYLTVLEAKNPRTAADTKGRLKKHFLPKFGAKPLAALTKTMLDNWLSSMVSKSDDPEAVRRSKDSANRVLSMVKAALNHALKDPFNGLADDKAWKLVKPFQGVGQPRDIRFTEEEVQCLVEACPDQATANLVLAAYLTGARYGELVNAKVADYDPKAKSLTVNGKTGRRSILLQTSADRLFSALVAERSGQEHLLVKKDGTRWKRSEQTRPIEAAISAVGLEGSIYALRHTYISEAIEREMPLTIIAENCGTSVRMIEKTYAKPLAERKREFIERGAPNLTF